MTIHGRQERFAVELVPHPESPRELGQAYGMFRFWIAGRSYGRSDPSATCLAASHDSIRERAALRGHHVALWADSDRPERALQEAYRLVYVLTEDDPGAEAVPPEHIAQAEQIIMAPDGDEAFDDGSFVVQWDEGERVHVAGGVIADGDPGPDELVGSPIRSVSLSADEFYGILSDCLEEFERLTSE